MIDFSTLQGLKIPVEYTQVEYIESSGTQYIDTGVTVKSTLKSQLKFNMTEVTGHVIYGSLDDDTTDYRLFNASGVCYLDLPDSNRIYGGSMSAGVDYEVEVGNYYVKDLTTGTNIISGTAVTFSEQTNTMLMWLSRYNGSNTYSSGKLYYLKIYDGDTLVRDFVPCVKLDGEVGLYDTVNDVFYSNAGSGTFTAGAEVGALTAQGVVTQITDASGNVLWSAASWPDDLDTGLEFASASAFTISVSTVGWDGTMEYCNGKGWKTWDGSEISSGETDSGQCIYLRGTGNTKVTGNSNSSYAWTLTGTGINCNGNIEKLLDYATVEAGNHPSMATYCYSSMFYDCTALTTAPSLPATTLTNDCYYHMFQGCTALTTAPSLPATTLATYCYAYMFEGCTALTTAPSLPATTLATYCYYGMFYGCTGLTTAPSLPATTLATHCCGSMFYGCTGLTSVPSLPATSLAYGCYQYMFKDCSKIKLSSSQTGTYTTAYRIPYSGTGKTSTYSLRYMFTSTGGTFTGTPSINTTYYLDSSNTIV